MRRLRLPLRFLAAVPLALALGVAPASAAAESVRFEITNFESNECTGEAVILEERVHVVVSATSNPDGSFRLRMHTNTVGVMGVGVVSGTSYSFARTSNLLLDVDVEGGTHHFVFHEEFIHHGEFGGLLAPALDDKHVHFNITVVLGAGPLAAALASQGIDCR